jgi:hypothetical protein
VDVFFRLVGMNDAQKMEGTIVVHNLISVLVFWLAGARWCATETLPRLPVPIP